MCTGKCKVLKHTENLYTSLFSYGGIYPCHTLKTQKNNHILEATFHTDSTGLVYMMGDYEENGYKTNVDIPYIAQF